MQVHAVKRTVEAAGAHRCCVVYGALPPEARSQQAALFNTPRSGFNVLAASDAVGMGLNLNIRCGANWIVTSMPSPSTCSQCQGRRLGKAFAEASFCFAQADCVRLVGEV